MTEHLTALLAREAEGLEIPPAPDREIIGTGRRLRRRRTATIWGGAALSVAVVAAAGSVLVGGHDTRTTQPAPASPPPISTAWAVDDTVYVGADGRAVAMPEVAQSLYFTSAGILVRTNKDGSSDGGAPFHFELVTDKATPTKVDVTLGDVVPSTDPSEPYLAWATMQHGQIQVIVHDVSTDKDVATVDVPGDFSWGGWEAPPVALSGDLVYVGTDDHTTVVNWRTGDAHTTDAVPGNTLPEITAGRTLDLTRGPKAHTDVVDVTSGRTLLNIPGALADSASLSPDGRFVMVTTGFDPPLRTKVYDVDTRTSITLPESNAAYAWSGNGDVIQVDGTTLTTCAATTGTCATSTVPSVGGNGLVRYTGELFES